jgi:hypothetical protein
MCRLYYNLGTSTSWKHQGLPRPCNGISLPLGTNQCLKLLLLLVDETNIQFYSNQVCFCDTQNNIRKAVVLELAPRTVNRPYNYYSLHNLLGVPSCHFVKPKIRVKAVQCVCRAASCLNSSSPAGSLTTLFVTLPLRRRGLKTQGHSKRSGPRI